MYATAHDCPNCGATIPFPAAIAVFAVCPYCKSCVVRQGVEAQVEKLGIEAQLPPDLSPLQVGTTGYYEGLPFTLIGRARVGYRKGSWNEWCADFAEGRWGWVAESQGFYQASFEIPPTAEALAAGEAGLSVGREFRFEGLLYTVQDVKETEVLGSEGSLPYAAVPGRTARSADLAGPEGRFANIEVSERENPAAPGQLRTTVKVVRVFLGRHLQFADLRFAELRPLPGWTTEATPDAEHRREALNCPGCGSPLELRAAGLSMSAVCAHCNGVVDASRPALQLITTAARRQRVRPLLTIGRRGKLRGTDYECIGLMVRADSGGWSWQEYLLFNPYAGFRWLVVSSGHWTLVDRLLTPPLMVEGQPVVDGRPHRLFGRGGAAVTYVVGEFYWQVDLEERTQVYDYVSPPWVVSREVYPQLGEETWSHGEYLPPEEVRTAFALQETLRAPAGVGMNQPNPHRAEGAALRRQVPVFALVLLLIALAAGVMHERAPAFQFGGVIAPGETNVIGTNVTFTIPGGHSQTLELTLGTRGLNNGWLETSVELVNLKTGAVETAALEADSWSGYDDGPWHEGHARVNALVPSVAPGPYQLLIEPSFDNKGAPVEFTLTGTRDVVVWTSLLFCTVAVLAYPAWRWFREHSFENARWAESSISGPANFPTPEGDGGAGSGLLDILEPD